MQRIWRVGFNVIPLAPVENQIGGEKYELDFRRQFREQFCGFDIQPARKLRIGFDSGNGADSGAVNDQLRTVFLKLPADGGEIEQVKPVARQGADRQPGSAGILPAGCLGNRLAGKMPALQYFGAVWTR